MCHLHLQHKSSQAQKDTCLLCAFILNIFGGGFLCHFSHSKSQYQQCAFAVTFLHKEQRKEASIKKPKF